MIGLSVRLIFVFLLAAGGLTACLHEEMTEPDQPLIGASAVEAQRAACETDGGTFGTGGITGALVCYRPTSDAGKACSASTDCTTECLARSRTCAPVEPLFGCNDILDALGRTVTLCRD